MSAAQQALLMASTASGSAAAVALLLHMNGTDGSTTFTDSSLNAFAMTANGNAQIDTAQSKFGGASGLLDGTGDYVSGTISAFDYGANRFCIETWVRFNAVPGSQAFFSFGGIGNNFYAHHVGGDIYVGNGIGNIMNPTWSPATGVWYHFALTYDLTTWRLFIDGVLLGSTTSPMNTGSLSLIYVGGRPGESAYINGWLDDFRVTHNDAVYTANFTPPVSEHPNP